VTIVFKSDFTTSEGTSDDLINRYDKDGNILELKRYDGDGSIADNFNYTYYSNTNKLQRVTGSGTQYTYDANGNMTRDNINRNRDIKYDHRNLITQLAHTEYVLEDSLLYATYYYYDEAGNRFRKKVYQYIGSQTRDSVEIPDIEEAGDSPGTWELIRDELYSRGADGKELAIYINGNIKQTNIWGLGHEGHITSSDVPNFYLKDHLGSIRIVTNENDEVISAQDYDCWGYLLEGRTYESDESVYKFTGKERDEENQYDYFGARYYDSRIGRWGQVEPLYEQYIQFSPYAYSICNPARFVDPMGLSTNDVILAGSEDDRNRALSDLQNETDLDLTMDANGKLSVKGKAKTKFDKKLKAAIRSKTITVTLNIIEENYTTDENGMRNYVIVGQYGGSSVDAKNITQAIQYINLNHAEVWNQAGGSSVGLSIKHEIVEAFIGAEKFPGQGFSQANYEIAHSRVRVLEGNQFYPPHGLNPQGTEMRLQDANGLPHLLYNIEP
jgi:RHS repeat-associated protein